VNVGYRATISGNPMSAPAAQEPDSQEKWHPRLADCFQVFGTGGERLLLGNLKVSFYGDSFVKPFLVTAFIG